jgi:putative CocE/NonD family hydrolase
VVLQDVRGRYKSAGEFNPYVNEGRDGFDTIEWAARQAWSNGKVGTFGLSYPGAVQWLAAMERPPHLVAMVPAMTFSTPRNFFYSGGVFDLSWMSWIWNSIAADTRVRKSLPGPRTDEEVDQSWERERRRMQYGLPLAALPDLREVAPYYYGWMKHPASDPWWDWAELRGKYSRVNAAVLNLSGWHDEAYGPEGALTNFQGLVRARGVGGRDQRTAVIVGPWVHGVGATRQPRSGDREFGTAAAIDYDETVLSWMDAHLRGIKPAQPQAPVRLFLMGANQWLESDDWPRTNVQTLYLVKSELGHRGILSARPSRQKGSASEFISDPVNPVEDPHSARRGAFDYRSLEKREDVLIFDSEPLPNDLDVVGFLQAEMYISTDALDTDLWVHVLDVAPDGTAFSLMSPGTNVVRASYSQGQKRRLLSPEKIYRLRFQNLITGNRFQKGHRVRVMITTSFMPHFSRNLHTGALEMNTSEMRKARIRLHHDSKNASRIELPVLPKESR